MSPARPRPARQDRLSAERRRTVRLLREIDHAWLRAFQGSGLNELHFSRLFMELWQRDGQAMPKTEAYELMTDVGLQTAIKYVRRAIERGELEEIAHPEDGRSRLLRMTPRLRRRVEAVIDDVQAALERASRPDPDAAA